MKVRPYSNSSFCFKSSNQKQNKVPETKQIAAYTVGCVALATGITYGLIRYNKVAVKKLLEKQVQQFPNDINYRKQILKLAGLENVDVSSIRSIVGPQEYKGIISELSSDAVHYTPGQTLLTAGKDSYELDGVKAKTFRATLHMHTIHSDGKLSVEELLHKSAKYADKVAKKIKNENGAKAQNAPFTIAITDHDTLEGCKEAVRIIAKNPEKYKNLRVVLGSEMSVENKMLAQEQKSPISQHMLVHCINPFDSNLNKFFDEKKQYRADLMKKLIENASEALPKYSSKFIFEEAEHLYPSLKHKITHVNFSMKDYLQYKIIFNECFENNSILQEKLKNAKINISKIDYNSFLDKCADKEKNYNNEYYYRYYDALKNYVADLLKITPDEAGKKLELTNEIKQNLKKAERICMDELPQMNLASAYTDIETAISMIKSQPHGYMAIAHPALTDIGSYLKNSYKSKDLMFEIFKIFKEKGEDRALAAEIHYHYFDDLAKNPEWVNLMKNFAERNDLYCIGGLDTHGKNIFYSGKS